MVCLVTSSAWDGLPVGYSKLVKFFHVDLSLMQDFFASIHILHLITIVTEVGVGWVWRFIACLVMFRYMIIATFSISSSQAATRKRLPEIAKKTTLAPISNSDFQLLSQSHLSSFLSQRQSLSHWFLSSTTSLAQSTLNTYYFLT